MRIIAGKFKGLNIKTINDPSTRPMMSRAREGIFNSLQNDFNNSLVLDLFAGRGDKQSECIFHITEGKSFSKITKDGQERLNAIEQNDDGFKLSELDLQIRGEGKVTGTSQSGLSDLKIANLRTDYEILETSKEYFSSMEDEEIKSELFLEANLLFPNFGKTKDST